LGVLKDLTKDDGVASRRRKSMKPAIMFIFLFAAATAGATSYPPSQVFETNEEAAVEMEKLDLHRLVSPGGPLAIPKSWRLISVSRGDKANSSNLWFQADDGSVYVVQGFASHNRFDLHGQVFKIPAR
jgi:hypothetical protein